MLRALSITLALLTASACSCQEAIFPEFSIETQNCVSYEQACVPSSFVNPITDFDDSEKLPVRSAVPAIVVTKKPDTKFHWRTALIESFELLALQHSLLVWSGDKQYIDKFSNGIPFDHYWRDYKHSLHTWLDSGWDDGDPFLDNYIGHPIQGALTGYIQVLNDPAGRALEFENSRRYWKSRIKAMLWNAAYSTQWEIGPLGEMTVEKYGISSPWLQNGKIVSGEGQVDLVVTPIGGLGWMVMEDYLDHAIVRRIENRTSHAWVRNLVRCSLNPIRSTAYMLHKKAPWYRESRDPGSH